MARKEKTIHYIYKTVCLISNRYYIGLHSTNNLGDGYMGSGKRLKYSIRKHGKDNHVKEILEYCNNREELVLREIDIVTKELIGDEKCMNLVLGGGGFMLDDYHYECAKNGNKKLCEKLKNDEVFYSMWLKNQKIGYNKAKEDGRIFDIKIKRKDWTGMNHTKESKLLISKKMIGNGIGKTNSQYGTCWVSHKNDIKKIKLIELEDYLINGWVKGKMYNIKEINEYYNIVKSYDKTAKYFNLPKSTVIDNIKNYVQKEEYSPQK